MVESELKCKLMVGHFCWNGCERKHYPFKHMRVNDFSCEGLPMMFTLLPSKIDLLCDFGLFEDIVHEVL